MVNLTEKMYRRKRPAERGLTKLSYVHVAWSKITNGKKGSSNWLNKVGIKKTFNWLFFYVSRWTNTKKKVFPKLLMWCIGYFKVTECIPRRQQHQHQFFTIKKEKRKATTNLAVIDSTFSPIKPPLLAPFSMQEPEVIELQNVQNKSTRSRATCFTDVLYIWRLLWYITERM